jgi:riboflavin biosynthesis pyrimidine reductase
VVAVGEGDAVDPTAAIGALRERGHGLVLSEAGPHLFGSLVEGGLVDELFLTVSPLLAGRDEAQRDLGLVEGSAFLPGTPQLGRLLSVRRDESHLFLRYELDSRA